MSKKFNKIMAADFEGSERVMILAGPDWPFIDESEGLADDGWLVAFDGDEPLAGPAYKYMAKVFNEAGKCQAIYVFSHEARCQEWGGNMETNGLCVQYYEKENGWAFIEI